MASMLGIETNIPLVVDLDGTLTVTDTLYESFAKLLFRDPLAALASLAQIARGPAAAKRYVARALPARCRDPAVPDRPGRPRQSREGARTADPPRDRRRPEHRRSVAGELGLFDSATGSNGAHNLKGPNKLEHLRDRFPDGFIYAGDGAADLPVFRAARGVILCDVGSATAGRGRGPRRAGQSAPSGQRAARLDARLPRCTNGRRTSCCSCRCSSATPMATRARSRRPLLGFMLLCLLSSATYIINDLADLDADRAARDQAAAPVRERRHEDRARPDRRAADDRRRARRRACAVAAVRGRAARLSAV